MLGLALAAAPAGAQVSLATVVDLAQRNSSAVRLAEADVRKAGAALSESKDVLIPSLLFSTGLPTFPEVGFTGTPPSIWTATVQSLVFSIPQKHYIDAARFGLQAANANLYDAREQVALDASLAYIELDTVSRELDAARQQEDFANRLVAIEQERAEAGVDSLSELLQARLTAAQIKLRRVQLEARAGTLSTRMATLTGMPVGSIRPEHASIPEIPKVNGDGPAPAPAGSRTAELLARSKQQEAKGDREINYLPQLSFGAQYNRNTTILNSVNQYFKTPLPANNFSSGIAIQVPLFDMWHRAKGRESAADALRANVEAEEAQRKSDVQIAQLSGALRELDAQAEVAGLNQQIAQEQLKTVQTQLQVGTGAGANAQPQPSPKAEELARIDERQKYQDALEAGLELTKTRLSLLRALGHMQDWLNELHGK
ncbi:MAG: TolC family protein [Acidobacteriota bacterium]|nr:TolC family protein [Acidobacteriota bacterium]